MSKQLDRAKCERLRDMGMPQKPTQPLDLYHIKPYDGDPGPGLYPWMQLPSRCLKEGTYSKCPSNDELEAFAIGKVREWMANNHPEFRTFWRLVVWWRECNKEYAAFVESEEDEFIDHLVTASPSKSLALYNLIEKLDAMIKEK